MALDSVETCFKHEYPLNKGSYRRTNMWHQGTALAQSLLLSQSYLEFNISAIAFVALFISWILRQGFPKDMLGKNSERLLHIEHPVLTIAFVSICFSEMQMPTWAGKMRDSSKKDKTQEKCLAMLFSMRWPRYYCHLVLQEKENTQGTSTALSESDISF